MTPSHMFRRLQAITLALLFALLAGCSSVPMATKEQDTQAKGFASPPADKIGLYIYRDSFFGQALQKNLSIDGKLIGATANKVYFYKTLNSGPHTIATQSEFGDNVLQLNGEAGKNYFVRQYIKMGVFVGGSDLERVSDEEGKKAVLTCQRALDQ